MSKKYINTKVNDKVKNTIRKIIEVRNIENFKAIHNKHKYRNIYLIYSFDDIYLEFKTLTKIYICRVF